MSWLSSGLAKIGISKSTQRAVTKPLAIGAATLVAGPGAGAAVAKFLPAPRAPQAAPAPVYEPPPPVYSPPLPAYRPPPPAPVAALPSSTFAPAPVAGAPASLPSWVMPAAIGGGVLLLVLALRK